MKFVKQLILMLGIFFVGCSEKEVEVWNGEEGIYFAVRYTQGSLLVDNPKTYAHQPYSTISFLSIDSSYVDTTIRVSIVGAPQNRDREFLLTVDRDSTTAQEGLEYMMLEEKHVIPAGCVYADVPLRILCSERIKNETVILGLRLEPNENFKIMLPVWYPIEGMDMNVLNNNPFDASYHAVYISNVLIEPTIWMYFGAAYPGTLQEYGRWGVFSEKKINLMCEVCGLKYADFEAMDYYSSKNLAISIAIKMRRYLEEQFVNGTPVKEDDGRLMWVEGVSWDSFVGVAYE